MGLVVRRVPKSYTKAALVEEFASAGFRDCLVCLPLKSKGQGNRSFAFLNFECRQAAQKFICHFNGKHLREPNPKGPLLVMLANVQGLSLPTSGRREPGQAQTPETRGKRKEEKQDMDACRAAAKSAIACFRATSESFSKSAAMDTIRKDGTCKLLRLAL